MWPRWAERLDYGLIERIAMSHQLEPRFVAAVVQTESAGNTNACRYEPNFKYLTPNHKKLARLIYCDALTMEFIQKTSWGLMQVMGAVAYEHGLEGERYMHRRWPTSLLTPAIGLRYGCLHLKLKETKWGPKPTDIYAAYNAGSVRTRANGSYVNHENVARFDRFYRELKSERS